MTAYGPVIRVPAQRLSDVMAKTYASRPSMLPR